MRFSKKDIIEFTALIKSAKHIILTTHNNPDGDAIGSMTAMYHYLKSLGKDALMIVPNDIKEHISFVLNGTNYLVAERHTKEIKPILKTADLLIALDMNSISRSTESIDAAFKKNECKRVVIDHHESPDKFDLCFSRSESSSACEVVYNVLSRLANKKIFSKEISTALYLGIVTDTGNLTYSCNSPDLYIVISNILKSGIQADTINQQIFNTYSLNRLSLLGYCINKKLRFFPKQRAAFITLSKGELKKFHYEPGDLEGVVNYCMRLKDVDFGALISDRDGKIKMSFRSKNNSIDVNKFANRYWNGGGHIRAAGGKSSKKLSEVIKILTHQILNYDFIYKGE